MRAVWGLAAGLMTLLHAVSAEARRIAVTSASLGRTERHFVAFDRDSMKQLDGHVRAWTYAFYKTEKLSFFLTGLVEVDCRQERFRYLQRDFYRIDHTFDIKGDPTEWEFASPDSNNGALIAGLCATKARMPVLEVGDSDPFQLMDKLIASKSE